MLLLQLPAARETSARVWSAPLSGQKMVENDVRISIKAQGESGLLGS